MFEFRDKLELFFEKQNRKTAFFDCLNDENWISSFAHLVNIFKHLNEFKVQMKRNSTNIIKYSTLKSFLRANYRIGVEKLSLII